VSLFARSAWIEATEFLLPRGEAVLSEVVRRVAEERDAGARPLVLFDVDGTLYENRPRIVRILAEWIASRSDGHERMQAILQRLSAEAMFYGPREALISAGLDAEAEEILAEAEAFWTERFFSNAYLTHDVPYPRAASYLTRLSELGAEIGYLTGRDVPRMGEGTRAMLTRDGFPVSGRVRWLLKPDPKLGDAEHKRIAVSAIADARVIAFFDNEPHHLLAVQSVLQEAMHVFFDTIASATLAPAGRGLYYVREW
jgi:hypothetical protein